MGKSGGAKLFKASKTHFIKTSDERKLENIVDVKVIKIGKPRKMAANSSCFSLPVLPSPA